MVKLNSTIRKYFTKKYWIYDIHVYDSWRKQFCDYEIYVNGDMLCCITPFEKKSRYLPKSKYHKKNKKFIIKNIKAYLELNGYQERK